MILSDRYQEALNLAFELHRNDFRKAKSTPYMAHLLCVSSMVMEDGGNEEEAIAALLHDALEDHPELISFEEIGQRFGSLVAEIVRGCSDTPDDYTGGAKPAWRERKQAYLDHLKQTPQHVLRVALADKLHNSRDICNDLRSDGEKVWDRFNADRDEQLWYFGKLLTVFAERFNGSKMLRQFKDVVEEIKNQ